MYHTSYVNAAKIWVSISRKADSSKMAEPTGLRSDDLEERGKGRESEESPPPIFKNKPAPGAASQTIRKFVDFEILDKPWRRPPPLLTCFVSYLAAGAAKSTGKYCEAGALGSAELANPGPPPPELGFSGPPPPELGISGPPPSERLVVVDPPRRRRSE